MTTNIDLLRLLVQAHPPQRAPHPRSNEFASILRNAKRDADDQRLGSERVSSYTDKGC